MEPVYCGQHFYPDRAVPEEVPSGTFEFVGEAAGGPAPAETAELHSFILLYGWHSLVLVL